MGCCHGYALVPGGDTTVPARAAKRAVHENFVRLSPWKGATRVAATEQTLDLAGSPSSESLP